MNEKPEQPTAAHTLERLRPLTPPRLIGAVPVGQGAAAIPRPAPLPPPPGVVQRATAAPPLRVVPVVATLPDVAETPRPALSWPTRHTVRQQFLSVDWDRSHRTQAGLPSGGTETTQWTGWSPMTVRQRFAQVDWDRTGAVTALPAPDPLVVLGVAGAEPAPARDVTVGGFFDGIDW